MFDMFKRRIRIRIMQFNTDNSSAATTRGGALPPGSIVSYKSR